MRAAPVGGAPAVLAAAEGPPVRAVLRAAARAQVVVWGAPGFTCRRQSSFLHVGPPAPQQFRTHSPTQNVSPSVLSILRGLVSRRRHPSLLTGLALRQITDVNRGGQGRPPVFQLLKISWKPESEAPPLPASRRVSPDREGRQDGGGRENSRCGHAGSLQPLVQGPSRASWHLGPHHSPKAHGPRAPPPPARWPRLLLLTLPPQPAAPAGSRDEGAACASSSGG